MPDERPNYPKETPAELSRMAKQWEGVEVTLRCRRCQQEFTAERPRYWLDRAKARGDENPWWWGICDACRPADDARLDAFVKKKRRSEQEQPFALTDRSEEEEGQGGPSWSGPEPTADEEFPTR